MSTISSLGVGSGIDVRGLVDQLIEAERQPEQRRLDNRQATIEAQISGLGRLQEGLKSFGSVVSGMQDTTDFQKVVAQSSNSSVLEVGAEANAPEGNYEVEVVRLAQSQRLATNDAETLFGAGFSAGSTELGAGDVTLTYADGSEETFTLEAGTSTLQDLRAAINAQSGKARAEVVDDGNGDRLVLTSTQTGEDNAISGIGVSGTDPAALLNELAFDAATMDANGTSGGFTQLRASQDAEIQVDGMTITRPTNEFSQAIDGVSLTLSDVGTTRVSVRQQAGQMEEKIQGFVEAYNTLRESVNTLGEYDPETGESGILNGDSTLRNVQFALSRAVGEMVDGMGGSVRALSDLGITSRRDGTLEVDEFKLSQAVSSNPEGVMELFTREGDGLAARMDGVVQQYTGWDSIITTRNQGLQSRLEGLAEDREDLDRRMENMESRLIAQFSAMDAKVAALNKTSEYLDNQLAALNGSKQ